MTWLRKKHRLSTSTYIFRPEKQRIPLVALPIFAPMILGINYQPHRGGSAVFDHPVFLPTPIGTALSSFRRYIKALERPASYGLVPRRTTPPNVKTLEIARAVQDLTTSLATTSPNRRPRALSKDATPDTNRTKRTIDLSALDS